MKAAHLSDFQKEQYTIYLETQLEKFSAFMLAQKKDNQRCMHLEDLIETMGRNITQLTERIQLLEFYQKENFRQSQKMQTECAKTVEFDHRLKKVESMYFQRPIDVKSKENNPNAANVRVAPQIRELQKLVEARNKQMGQKIRNMEHQIENLYSGQERFTAVQRAYCGKRESEPMLTNYSETNSVNYSNPIQSQGVTKGELRATENKIYSMFDKKFSRIEQMIHRSFQEKEKSRSSKKQSQKNSEHSHSNILAKEQTFGLEDSSNSHRLFQKSERSPAANFQTIGQDPHEMAVSWVKNEMNERSCQFSDTSQRLRPVTHQGMQEQKLGPIKKANKKSRRKNKEKSHSKSIAKSESRSKSKSGKNLCKTNVVKQFRYGQSNYSPYTDKSQSRSVSKASRSKSTKNDKPKRSSNARDRAKKVKKQELDPHKQYLMDCRKNHFGSRI